MEQPKRIGNNGLSKLSKHLWYLIIVRLPKAMQQQIENINLSMVICDKPKFAENKRYWDTIVLYYWQKRFEQSQKDSILRYRNAVISSGIHKINCECGKIFNRDAVNPCWCCNTYLCTRCATIKLKDAFPNMSCPTTCAKHTQQCTRCEQLFIPVVQEEHCFDCQHQNKMYTVKWAHNCKVDAKLPYGSFQLQQKFAEFIKKNHSVKPANGQDLIGGVAGWGQIIIGTNTVALGENLIANGYNAHPNYD